MDIKNSYTAADSLPAKLVRDYRLVEIIANRKVIPPVHVQFIPTNKCNMNCEFCSCAEDDRKTEMSIDDAGAIIAQLRELGTKAVTVTGGGEPLLYPYIQRLLWSFALAGIQIGLVTNGLLLKQQSEALKCVVWCRISNDDKRSLTGKYRDDLSEVVNQRPNVDWAFSHVISANPNIDEIQRVIEFANKHEFTHVRLVADILHPDAVDMGSVRHDILQRGVDDRLVIYQPRNEPKKGGDCYICYLKPIIGADCKVYTCCGVQYALDPPSKKMPKELCLGSAFKFHNIIERSHIPFKGQICKKCYYTNYNIALKAMLTDVDHECFL